MKNQIMNALVAASVRCFCCVHKFIDFAWVRKPFIFSLTHDLFWMDIQCSWVRRMSRMSHCDSEQKIKKWNNTLVQCYHIFLHANNAMHTVSILKFHYDPISIVKSRLVNYSILELFGQRSQYIRIKFLLLQPSENPWVCY